MRATVVTGMPLKFYYTDWARTVFAVMGGPEVARSLHHFGALVTFLFFAAMAWQYVRYAAEMARAGERMAILRWEVWPFWWAVALCIIATALVALWVLLRRD